jgi:hypothetical protein
VSSRRSAAEGGGLRWRAYQRAGIYSSLGIVQTSKVAEKKSCKVIDPAYKLQGTFWNKHKKKHMVDSIYIYIYTCKYIEIL